MCGIVGYLDRTGARHAALGTTMLRMLTALGCRGPGSAGVALDADRAHGPSGHSLYRLRAKVGEAGSAEHDQRVAESPRRVGAVAEIRQSERVGESLRLEVAFGDATAPESGCPEHLPDWIAAVDPNLEVVSFGRARDVVKQVGSPEDLDQQFGLRHAGGRHAIGHTRLSTESRIDLSRSQPFWAHGGPGLATVHNGQVTDYHKLRRQYEQRGMRFYTENDSEIIGIYLAEAMTASARFDDALRGSVGYVDGSFSNPGATEHEIGYAKDPFGLKSLIVAESDQVVALATEESALQAAFGPLATTWEPQPGTVKTWSVDETRAAPALRPTPAPENAW